MIICEDAKKNRPNNLFAPVDPDAWHLPKDFPVTMINSEASIN